MEEEERGRGVKGSETRMSVIAVGRPRKPRTPPIIFYGWLYHQSIWAPALIVLSEKTECHDTVAKLATYL